MRERGCCLVAAGVLASSSTTLADFEQRGIPESVFQ